MGWFNLSTKKRPAAQGFKPAKARRYAGKAIRLEEMNTPSVLLPVPDSETVEEPGIDVNEDLLAYLPTYNEIAGEDASVDELADIQDSDEIKVQMDADDVENSDIDINNLGLSKGFDDTYIPDEDLEEIPFIHFSDEMSDSAGDETNLSALAETNFDIQKDIADEEVEEIPLATLANEISDDSEGDADRVAIAQTSDSSSDELNTGEIDETANDEADTPIKISDSNIENANPDEVTGEAGEIASVEIDAIAIDETEDTTSEDGDLTSKTDDIASADTDTPVTSKTDDIASADTDTPVTSETDDIASADTDTPVTGEIDDAASVIVVDNIANPQLRFDSGVFTVGETGKVEIDFLFDGGGYKGEVAIISLEGLEKYEPGSEEFIKEAAFRANSHSELGYIAISDREEGARFTAELGEINQNEGAYLGVKTFIMRSGDQFGIMLVPNGTIQQVFDNPAIGGALRPLFSMATANPLDNYQVGQLADVTGDGSAFAIEDMRVDGWTDKDYNDIVFQVRGATGKAALMDDVVNPVKDWRGTDMGVALIEYVKAYVTPEEPADDLEGAIAELLDDLEDFTDDLDAIAPIPISLDLDEVSVDADAPNADLPELVKTFDERSNFTPEEMIVDADNPTTDITKIVETSDKVTDPLPEKILVDATETPTGASAEVGEESIVNPDNSATDILEIVETSSDATEPVIEVSPSEVVAENPPADIPELVETSIDATEPEEVLVNPPETPVVEISETGEESAIDADNSATDIPEVVKTSSETTEPVLQVSPAVEEVVAENLPADLSKVVETSSAATETVLEVSPAVEEVVAEILPADLSKEVVETSDEVTKIGIEKVIDNPPADATDPVSEKVIDEVIKNPALDRIKIVGTSAEEISNISEASPVVEDKIVHTTENPTIQILETVETFDETDNATEAVVNANKIVIDANENSSNELTKSFNPESEKSEIDREFLPQPPTNVKAQLISRLESLTESLKQQETSASGGTSVSVALLEKLETLTENLKNQSREIAVNEKTINLISRLEDMVVRRPLAEAKLSLPPAIAPIESPHFEFAKADQPLIGVIETGFSATNIDIDYSQITWGQDRVDGDADPTLKAGEGSEHGTHILGIIAAKQDNGIGIDGINDDAPIWASRAIGSGKWHDSLVEFVDAAKASAQPNAVVNLSLDLTQIDDDGNVTTRYEFTPQERAAIEYARQHNVMIVVAAGNDGGVMSALGQGSQEFDNIINVGAAERVNDEIALSKAYDRANYSSFGYGLDIMADGDTTLSTVGDGFGTMAGTSVATAKVTGAASQVWAANPNLSYRQVIEILKSTATDLKTPNWDDKTGAGLLNMVAAIGLAKATKPEEYDPEAFATPTTWSGEGKVTPTERAAGVFDHLPSGGSTAIASDELQRLNQIKSIVVNIASSFNIHPAIVAGIISRETNTRNIIGDGGRGHGYMQLDIGTFPNIKNQPWSDPAWNIQQGVNLLINDKYAYLKSRLPDSLHLRGSLAAYNSGQGNVVKAYQYGLDVDAYTTGKNYSADVLNRARWLVQNGWGSNNNTTPANFTGKVLNAGYVQQVGFLRVRSGPGTTNYSEVSRLYPGNVLQFSGETQGQWVGDPNMPGGGSSTWYRLANGSGWVSGQYIEKVSLDKTVGYDGTSTHQTYINTFNRNGGQAALGSPTNNVHPWENGYTQDFSGGSEGKGAIMKSNANDNSYWVGSDFWNKFLEIGGAGGILRYPTSDRYGTNGGWRQNFQGGAIIKSSKGIFPLYGGIGAHYLNSEGGEKGRLGFPTSGEVGVGNGVIHQHFENGYIRFGDGPTRTVMNVQTPAWQTAIDQAYTASPVGLGSPISGYLDALRSPQGTTGKYRVYEKGTVHWSPQYGAVALWFDVPGGAYAQNGGSGGWLGFPTKPEYDWNGGRRTDFEGGYIYWNGQQAKAYRPGESPNTPTSVTIGGYTVSGNFYPVFQKYQGTLGNPISGVINHSSGATYQLFQNGSIVSSQYGTFPLYGGIRQTYLNHGGLNGWLGAPKSAEYGLGNGVIRQDFANGYIIWNGSKATAYQYGSGTSTQPKPPTQPNPGTNPNPGNGQRIIDAVNKVNPDQWYYRRRDITGDGIVETFCNWFAADVLECLGVPIPRQTNSPYKMNPPVFGGANRDKPISAEQLYTFFNNGGGGKWQKVSAADAAAKANNGQAVVASSYGHIAIVIPGSSASNVRIAQAGWENGKNMGVKDGFGNNSFSYFAYVG